MMNDIEDHLRRAYRHAQLVQQEWITVADDPSALDDILNQLDQRLAITSTSLNETSLESVSFLKERLLLKIDTHITDLCHGRIVQRLDSMRDHLEMLKSLNEEAKRQGRSENSSLSEFDLEERTETRPSIRELFSWLDEIIVFLENDLANRCSHIERFQCPDDRESITELRRCWKVPYATKQRWNSIRFNVITFLEEKT